jgi:DNA-binding CsgD family transcriptional regulator
MPENWPDTLLSLANACGGGSAFAQMVGDHYAAMISTGHDGMMRDYFESTWNEWNPRMDRGIAMTRAGVPGLLTERHMFSAEELARQPFQQEFAKRNGIDSEAGMVVASHANQSFVLTVQRPARIGIYEGRELADMNRLVTQIADACSFALRLKLVSAAKIAETLDARGDAVALLSASGRILFATAEFEKHIGQAVLVRRDELAAREPADNAELQAQIRRAVTGPIGQGECRPIILRGPSGPIVARCMPIAGAAQDFLGIARVLVAIDDPGRRRVPPDTELRRLYNLTAAEARLARRIGNGEPLRAAAEAERITFETARSRLKVIFDKTGLHRQTDLARLVDRLSR